LPERLAASPRKSAARLGGHNRWLLLIAAYKFFHALVFVAIGLGAHRLLHKDIADEIDVLAHHLRFNPESRLISFVLSKAPLINDPLLRRIGFFAFCYAAVTFVEGFGLVLEKAWGEFLTLAITASFLPWELFEVVRRLTWVRVALFAVNLFVFLYLLKLVIEQGRNRAHRVRKA
jgi:uncharacterized membrane protein (DUF2068 family)